MMATRRPPSAMPVNDKRFMTHMEIQIPNRIGGTVPSEMWPTDFA